MLEKLPPNAFQLLAMEPSTGDDREPWWPAFEPVPASTLRTWRAREREAKNRRDPIAFISVPFHKSEIDAMTLVVNPGKPEDRDKVSSKREWHDEVAAVVRGYVVTQLKAKKPG